MSDWPGRPSVVRRAVELPLFVGASATVGALAARVVVPASADPSTDPTAGLGMISAGGAALHLVSALWATGMALDLLPWRALRGALALFGGLGAAALAMGILRDQPVSGALAASVAGAAGLALTASSAAPSGPGRWPALPLILALCLAVVASLAAGGLAAAGSMTSVYALFALLALTNRAPSAGCCTAAGLLVLAPVYGSAAALASGPAAAVWVLLAALGSLFTPRGWRWLWWVTHGVVAIGAAVGWSLTDVAAAEDRAVRGMLLFVLSVGGANAGLLGAVVLGHVPPPEDRAPQTARSSEVGTARPVASGEASTRRE